MRVLVVEDEKKTASFIRKALQAEGFGNLPQTERKARLPQESIQWL